MLSPGGAASPAPQSASMGHHSQQHQQQQQLQHQHDHHQEESHSRRRRRPRLHTQAQQEHPQGAPCPGRRKRSHREGADEVRDASLVLPSAQASATKRGRVVHSAHSAAYQAFVPQAGPCLAVIPWRGDPLGEPVGGRRRSLEDVDGDACMPTTRPDVICLPNGVDVMADGAD